MSATIVRNPAKLGLTLLSSNVTMADDGFIRVTATFLAPATGLGVATFAEDARWPLGTPPANLPLNQGGPYLTERTFQKENGLTTISAVYVTAANPPRVARSESTSKATFSGYKDSETGSGSLSFDYYTTSVTLSYALIYPTVFSVIPSASISTRAFNIRGEGNLFLVPLAKLQTFSSQRERVGKVARISITADMLYEQPGDDQQISNARYGSAGGLDYDPKSVWL